jgi:hypothetical protein
MRTIAFILIVPGLIAFYALFLRHVLASVPAFKRFYAEADGFWASVWAVCGNSLTLAWSYFVIAAGAAVQAIDPIASALGDPDLKAQVTTFLSANPKALGYFAIAVSVITILSRLRTLGKTV